ncbi:MAG: DMT family transporter [Deltaproteobacteria bacterium]|nr:DMT family transporter [Deltaproteobacteria bacterium]
MSSAALQRRALVAVGVTVFTWGWSSVLIKAVAVSGLVASFYRLWLSLPLLWLIALARRDAGRGLDRAWLRGSLIGGALFALHQALFFSALKATTVANVALIGALQPTLVLLVAGRWFGEPAGARAFGWSLVALAGAALVIAGAAGLPGWSPFGDALAFGNLFAFTAYFLASKRIRRRVATTDYLIGMTTVAAVIMLAICLANGEALGSPQGAQWLVLLVLALVPGTLGHFLINWAHPHTSAFAVSILLLASPVVACGAAALVLGEQLNLTQVIGAAISLTGVAAVVLTQPARRAEDLAASAAETDAP